MRILFILHGVYPHTITGGVENYVYSLGKALNDRDHKVAFAAIFDGEDGDYDSMSYFKLPRVSGSALNPAPTEQQKTIERLRSVIEIFQPSIVHIHHLYGIGSLALDFLQKIRIPLILSLHDYFYLCPGIQRMCKGSHFRCAVDCIKPYHGKGYFFRLFLGWIESFFWKEIYLKKLNKGEFPILANSQRTLEIYMQNGLKSQRVTIHYLGIDVKNIRHSVRRTLDFSKKPRFGFMGSWREFKGAKVLLSAFVSADLESELHVWGPGDKEVIELSRKIKNICYHGIYEKSKLDEVFGSFDILVFPSIWEETYGLVIQEALAARKIVIASNIGGITERITDGINGFLVPPGNVKALIATMRNVYFNYETLSKKIIYNRFNIDINEDAQWHEGLYKQTMSLFSGV